jgi:predicted RNase H-like HicB family nuclease
MAEEVYTVRVRHEPGEELWAEVLELPGCFVGCADREELPEALSEAISLHLSEPGEAKRIDLEDEPDSVTEHRILARTAWRHRGRLIRAAAPAHER